MNIEIYKSNFLEGIEPTNEIIASLQKAWDESFIDLLEYDEKNSKMLESNQVLKG